MTRILLIDDDHLFLECLEHTLTKDYADFQIVGKLDLNADVVESVDELKPAVIIIGIRQNNDHSIENMKHYMKNTPR